MTADMRAGDDVAKEPTPKVGAWGRDEVASCPYLDDEDEFPVHVRIPTECHRETLGEDIPMAIDHIMGGWHPEASRRAKVAGRRLAMRISQFFPVLWDAGVNPTVDIGTEVAVDSYGNTWLADGDPFKSVEIRMYHAICDDRYDMRDQRHVRVRGSMEVALYEPSDDDPEQIVHVVASSGCDCVGTDEMGLFVESDSSGVECDEDISRAVDMAFFKLMTGIMGAMLKSASDRGGGAK